VAIVTADGLGLRTRRGWVFRDVSLAVEPGELLAITGPAGSGRTSLLLALAGHFRTTTGTRRLAGHAGVGFVPGLNEPERGLTAAEHVQERLLLLGQRPYGRGAFANTVSRYLADLPVEEGTLGRDLTPYQRQRLMLRLAELSGAELVVADDVDAGLSGDEREWLWQALEDVAAQGKAVIVTCREPAGKAIEYALEKEQ
jgi:ABC-type multidrug transport system ATPase subunit